MLNPNNLIADSDYPFDMVAKVISGEFVLNGYYFEDNIVEAHGLNFTPLLTGYWGISDNPDVIYPFDFVGAEFVVFAAADSKNIYFSSPVFDKKIFYNIICLIPSFIDAPIRPQSLAGFKNFIFNTDEAYLKIATEGILTRTTEQRTIMEVEHNLGYIPFVRCWNVNYEGAIFQIGGSSYSEATITDEKLIIKFESVESGGLPVPGDSKFTHVESVIYRIYADEA